MSDSVPRAIQSASSSAAIAILGFEPPEEGHETGFFDAIEVILGPLPRVLLVKSTGGMELES